MIIAKYNGILKKQQGILLKYSIYKIYYNNFSKKICQLYI